MNRLALRTLLLIFLSPTLFSSALSAYTPLIEQEYNAMAEDDENASLEQKSIASIIDAFRETKGTFNPSINHTTYLGPVIAMFNKKTTQLCVVVESRKKKRYCIMTQPTPGAALRGEVLTAAQFLNILRANGHWRGYAMPSAKAGGDQIGGGAATLGIGAICTVIGALTSGHRSAECFFGGIACMITGIVLLALVKKSLYPSTDRVYAAAQAAVGEKYEKVAGTKKISLLSEEQTPAAPEAPAAPQKKEKSISLLPEDGE